MSSIHAALAAHIIPPRRGLVLAVAIDSTARPYNLGALAFAGYTPSADSVTPAEVMLTMQADGCDVFYYFHSATASDLDNTAAVSAGGSPAYATTYAAKVEDGDAAHVMVNRAIDKFLVVKSASGASGTLRIWASSQSSQ